MNGALHNYGNKLHDSHIYVSPKLANRKAVGPILHFWAKLKSDSAIAD